jgi:hypothetical protein
MYHRNDLCIEQIPLMSLPGLAPIDLREYFPAHMSAESPSIISPDPSEVISEVSHPFFSTRRKSAGVWKCLIRETEHFPKAQVLHQLISKHLLSHPKLNQNTSWEWPHNGKDRPPNQTLSCCCEAGWLKIGDNASLITSHKVAVVIWQQKAFCWRLWYFINLSQP